MFNKCSPFEYTTIVEECFKNKCLNPRTVANKLNISRSCVQFAIKKSLKIQRVTPLNIGSNKYDKTFNVFTNI